MFYNYLYFLASDLHDARLRAIASLAQCYRLPEDSRQTCWIFTVIEKEIKSLGLSDTDCTGMIMMICWA